MIIHYNKYEYSPSPNLLSILAILLPWCNQKASPLKLPIIFETNRNRAYIYSPNGIQLLNSYKTFEESHPKRKILKLKPILIGKNNTSNHWKQLIEVLLFDFLKTISDLSSKKHTF
jgi:hypothetical protein